MLLAAACSPSKPQEPPPLRRILYALPDKVPEGYSFRVPGGKATAIAWLAGNFKGDGSLHLQQTERIESMARLHTGFEHHLLLTEASVKAGNELLARRAAARRAANHLQAALARMPYISAVHLDFEYNGPGLAVDYVEFVHLLHKAMRRKARLYVTVIPPVGMPQKWSAFFLPDQLTLFSDGIVVMLYDLHRDGTQPGCVSGLEWIAENVAAMSTLPPEKIWLGAPLYGYKFIGKKASAVSRRAFAKIMAQETEMDGCRVKQSGGSKAYYPAPSLYEHYEKLVALHGFAGIAYWQAGWER